MWEIENEVKIYNKFINSHLTCQNNIMTSPLIYSEGKCRNHFQKFYCETG